ncbi:Hsp70 family protein [Actinoplanes awajinensis]|uniref:Hsp70 family protein n=1 Tax=Actinoplanes awajinensis TaxID=135946 RepID=UPI00082BCA99|nr:Hsp70 family protein [Actinoplanes awajinensis]
MGYDLGVDLGTTFVAAAISRDGRTEMCTLGNQTVVTPAVVFLSEPSRLVFGDAAERRALSHPDRVERAFKRRLGDPTPVVLGGIPHAVTALMSAQLRDVLDTVTRVEGVPPDRVALTYPANWGPYRRELFEEIPRLAGLHDYVLLTEPEAAAAFYGASRLLAEGDTLAVYDLGGGTFDATVLRKRAGFVEVIGDPDGMERLGGIDFDEAILQWLNYQHGGALAELDLSAPESAAAMANLRQECVQAKEALSVDVETTIPILLPNRHFVARLTRPEFEGLIRAPIESTIGTLIRAVHTARLDVGQLSAVLLVGGSSRIPLIERMVAAETGRPTVNDAHPKYAVALGAAMVAAGPRHAPAPAGPAPAPQPPWTPPPAHHDGPIRTGRSRRALALVAALAAVLLLSGTIVALTRDRDHSMSAAAPRQRPTPAATAARIAKTLLSAIAVPSLAKPVTLTSPPGYVAASPNGRQLYIASGDQTVSVLDTSTDRVTPTTIRVPGPARFLSFSPDGRYVYVSLWDRRDGDVHAVSILDTSDNTIKKTIPVRTRPFLAAVTPDGTRLYVPNHDGHTVTVIDTERMAPIAEITVPPEPHYVSFSVDGTRAYIADHESNEISVVDTATRKLLKNIKVGRSPHSVEQNPVRPLVINVNWDDDTVCAIDTTTHTVRRTIAVGNEPLNVNWSPDGRYAYVVNSGSDTLSVIRADNLQVTATLPTGKAPTSIAVLPDGSRGYVSNSKDNTLTVLDLTR